jgi:6-phosphogluconolactonase (cycloisomerase 2 family)
MYSSSLHLQKNISNRISSGVVSPDNKYFYGVNTLGYTITKYNYQDLSEIITVGTNSSNMYPISLALSPDGQYLYVAAYSNRPIYKYRTSDMVKVGEFNDGDIYDSATMAVSLDGQYLFVAGYHKTDEAGYPIYDEFGNGISLLKKIKASDMSLSKEVNFGCNYFCKILLSSDGQYIYSIQYAESALNKTSTVDLSLIAQLDTGVVGNTAFVLSPDNSYAYILSNTQNALQKFSIAGAGNSNGLKVKSITPGAIKAQSSSTTMIVNGSGFDQTSVISWNGLGLLTQYISSTRVSASIQPQTKGTFYIAVTNANLNTHQMTTSNTFPFYVNDVNDPSPIIADIDPKEVPVGSSWIQIDISGSDFLPTSQVYLDSTLIDSTYISPSQISLVIPVNTLNQSGVRNFTVTGATLLSKTITTTNGAGSTGIQTITPGIYSIRETFDDPWKFKTASCTISGSGGTGVLQDENSSILNGVMVNAGQVTTCSFTNMKPAQVNEVSINPECSVAGVVVTVSGEGFTEDSEVYFDSLALPTTYVSSDELTVHFSEVPSPGTYNVTVTDPDQGTSDPVSFTINDVDVNIPKLVSISPSSKIAGGSGFDMTVHGSNFTDQTVIQFGGQDKETTFVSSEELTVKILTSDIKNQGNKSVTIKDGSTQEMCALQFTVSSSLFCPVCGVCQSGTEINPNDQLEKEPLRPESLPYGIPERRPIILAVEGLVPNVKNLVPDSKIVGDQSFTLVITGLNFNDKSVVKIDGVAKETTFVSATELTADILTSDLATVGNKKITISNEATNNGVSAPKNLPVYSQGCPVCPVCQPTTNDIPITPESKEPLRNPGQR